jgi:hypothetical protein
VITVEGRSLMRKAWRRHHSGLRELFFDRLDDDDLRRLVGIWSRLAPADLPDRSDEMPGGIAQ